jgi:hypothetical protein
LSLFRRGSLERVDDRFGLLHCGRRIEWPGVYEFVEAFNSHGREQVRIVSLEGARGFPYSNDITGHYEFPVDGMVAYERTDLSLPAEIVNDPSYVMDALFFRTGKFAGKRNIALLALGLRSDDFRMEGKDVFVNITDDRLTALDVEVHFPDDGDHLPRAKSVLFKWSETDRYAGPIVVYLSNYDVSFSFGATHRNARLPAFDTLAVELLR